MKVLKVFSFVFLVCLDSYSQDKIQGFITELSSNLAIADVSIYNSTDDIISTSYSDGYFEINVINYPAEIIFYTEGFNLKTLIVSEKPVNEVNVSLESKIEELDEVIVRANRKKIFQIKRMKDFEQTRVFAGKKNEVILLELSMANLASNNARQVYSQIPGLNIYQNDDAGLQLNIGGRGLNPNRTANFNTRQNGYDISADALGYPESYYTPPAEALSEIEI